jgi:uncharacterized protein YxjI
MKLKIIDHIKYDDEGDQSDAVVSKRVYRINKKGFEVNKSGVFLDGDVNRWDFELNDEEHNV